MGKEETSTAAGACCVVWAPAFDVGVDVVVSVRCGAESFTPWTVSTSVDTRHASFSQTASRYVDVPFTLR